MAQICKTIITWISLTCLVDLCLISEVATKKHQLIAFFVSRSQSPRHTHLKASSQFLPFWLGLDDFSGFPWRSTLHPKTTTGSYLYSKISKSPPQRKSAWVTWNQHSPWKLRVGRLYTFLLGFRPIFRGFCCSFYRECTLPKNGRLTQKWHERHFSPPNFPILSFSCFGYFPASEPMKKKIRRKKHPVPKVPNAARDSLMSLIPWKTWWPWKSSTLHRFLRFFLGCGLVLDAIVRFW